MGSHNCGDGGADPGGDKNNAHNGEFFLPQGDYGESEQQSHLPAYSEIAVIFFDHSRPVVERYLIGEDRHSECGEQSGCHQRQSHWFQGIH